jgi:hypothetical protein
MDIEPLLLNITIVFGSVVSVFIIVFGLAYVINQLKRKQPTPYWEDGQLKKKKTKRKY